MHEATRSNDPVANTTSSNRPVTTRSRAPPPRSAAGAAVTRDEAVAQAMAKRPGLVLADIQLADDSSGIDAVKDILQEFKVPVIFITPFPERLLTGERPEPTFLITKRFQRPTVKAQIAQALYFDTATVPA